MSTFQIIVSAGACLVIPALMWLVHQWYKIARDWQGVSNQWKERAAFWQKSSDEWKRNAEDTMALFLRCQEDLRAARKQPSSPAPEMGLALQGGQEPPGSAGAGETCCPACEGVGGFVDPLTNDAFLCPVCRPVKISPAPAVGGAAEENSAEPTGDTGAGEPLLVDAATYVGLEEGDTCNRLVEGMDGACEGVLEYQKPVNCSCHINPPCGVCTEVKLECPECGWEEGE